MVDFCSILFWLFLAEPDGHLQKAAEILADYIIELRTFLKNYPRSQINATDVESDSDEDLPAIEESQVWEKLTPEVKANNKVLTVLIKIFKEMSNMERSSKCWGKKRPGNHKDGNTEDEWGRFVPDILSPF